MEAATIINNTPGLGSEEEVETPVEDSRPAIFKHTAHVNVPAECEGCDDPEHFHAWIRLPNKFQHKEIREKALAARARRLRVLREEDSDSRVILEDELALLLDADKAQLVEEIINQDSGKDMMQAVTDVGEIEAEEQPEEGETVYLYAHIDQDEERLQDLEKQDEEDRPTEEYEELVKHVQSYYTAIDNRAREIQDPERQTLNEQDMEDLVEIVRKHRIDSEGMGEFLHTYNSWMIVFGTLLADKSGRRFKHLDSLTDQAPEIVDALVETFQELESGARVGNP